MMSHYSAALERVLAEGVPVTDAVQGLRASLANRGHEQLYHRILRTVVRRLESGTEKTRLVVAREADAQTLTAEVSGDLAHLGADASPRIVIDESLVGGYVVEYNLQRIDRSYKRALRRLYESVTK